MCWLSYVDMFLLYLCVYFKWKHPCKYGRSIQGSLAKVEDHMLCAVTFVTAGIMLEHFKGREKACPREVVESNSTGQLSIY